MLLLGMAVLTSVLEVPVVPPGGEPLVLCLRPPLCVVVHLEGVLYSVSSRGGLGSLRGGRGQRALHGIKADEANAAAVGLLGGMGAPVGIMKQVKYWLRKLSTIAKDKVNVKGEKTECIFIHCVPFWHPAALVPGLPAAVMV